MPLGPGGKELVEMTKTERRIEDLEIKFAYQETTLDALNEVISRQQQQLD